MFKTLFSIHVFTILSICRCPETEKEVKTSRKEHIYLKYKRFSSDSNNLIKLGEELCAEKKYSEAMLAFSDVVAAHEDAHELAYRARGICYMQMKEINKAITDFQSATSLEKSPFNTSRLLLVNTLFGIGNYTEAVEYALHLRDFNMQNFADRLCSIEEFDKAMVIFKKLIVQSPRKEFYIARGNCHTKKGDMDKAHSDFQNAVDLDESLPIEHKPGYNHVLSSLALFRLGKINKEELSSLTEFQFTKLVAILFHQERLEDSIYCLSVAIEKYPKNAVFHKTRAYYNYKKQDYEKAISDYEKCVELDPSFLNCWIELVETLVVVRNYAEAKQKLKLIDSKMANNELEKPVGTNVPRLQSVRGKIYANLEKAQQDEETPK